MEKSYIHSIVEYFYEMPASRFRGPPVSCPAWPFPAGRRYLKGWPRIR